MVVPSHTRPVDDSWSLASQSGEVPPGGTVEAELVEAHLPLVGHLVRERLGQVPSSVCSDDLLSAGMLALVTSARCYDESRGVPFAHFAAFRIRGALTDELRSSDWAPRALRRRARLVETVTLQLVAGLNRHPTSHEVASAMGVDLADLESLRSELRRSSVISLYDVAVVGDVAHPAAEQDTGPESVLLQRERLECLRDALESLPDRLRSVVLGVFFEHRLMRDIAEELGVTQSRVSQMCTQALALMREGLSQHLDSGLADASQPGRQPASRQAYLQEMAARRGGTGRVA